MGIGKTRKRYILAFTIKFYFKTNKITECNPRKLPKGNKILNLDLNVSFKFYQSD